VKVLEMGFPLYGGGGSHELRGGLGPDHLSGGPGEDALFVGAGKHELHTCSDVATADRGDRVLNCERVHRS
jgi:Ca2+-binding RTX toxin-like protein